MENFTSTNINDLSSTFEESRQELNRHQDAAEKAWARWRDLRALADAQKKFHNFFTTFMKKFADADTYVKQDELRTKYRDKAVALINEVEKHHKICYPDAITRFHVKEETSADKNTESPEIDVSRASVADNISALKSALETVQKLRG